MINDATDTSLTWAKNSSFITVQLSGQCIMPMASALSKRELVEMRDKINDFISLYQEEFLPERIDAPRENSTGTI